MKTILIGGGKYAGLLCSMFSDQHEIAGYIDDVRDDAYVGERYGLRYLGDSRDLHRFFALTNQAMVAIGSEGDTSPRQAYFQQFFEAGFCFPSWIHSSAFVARSALVSMGTVVQVNAVIHPMVHLGRNCVISTSAIIGHDSIIGDNVYIGPGAVLNGSVRIGDNTFIGTNAVVIQKRVVGRDCTIGACACVIRDVPDHSKAVGVPARILKLRRLPRHRATHLT